MKRTFTQKKVVLIQLKTVVKQTQTTLEHYQLLCRFDVTNSFGFLELVVNGSALNGYGRVFQRWVIQKCSLRNGYAGGD